MTWLDDRIAGLGGGASIAIALAVALLLGLRHATDPDHLTAVSTLALGDGERGPRRAGMLGAAWGLGHATTLVLLGLPLVLLRSHLPAAVERAAELAVGVMIIALAVRLLLRWRRGYFHLHAHEHDGVRHVHVHVHEHAATAAHPRKHEHRHAEALGRTPAMAFGIGLIHGLGGSAGVAILLLTAIPNRPTAAVCLAVFALATALSMAGVSAAFGAIVTRAAVARQLERAVPVLGTLSLAFGVVYAVGAAG